MAKQTKEQAAMRKLGPAVGLDPTPQEKAAYEVQTYRAARKNRSNARAKGRSGVGGR